MSILRGPRPSPRQRRAPDYTFNWEEPDNGGLRYEIWRRLDEFYTFAARCATPEIHRLATTVDSRQEPMITAIETTLSNAKSEGENRKVNLSAASHSASETKTTNDAAYSGPAPAKSGGRHPVPTSSSTANPEEPDKATSAVRNGLSRSALISSRSLNCGDY
ncbi:hypothetical protein EH165_12455 [Nakamurella antarctica]|uniref:Transposase IS204/IS1001/IS1096/IS1165 DDE domain-containing protein n=1 Tax=Nakamurella antarctica TaxID=1902245 RepID=A0A3G8ZQL9_9ACTN|nr:hypothetical protein EH165_12455 [Nakamurella antarctica]